MRRSPTSKPMQFGVRIACGAIALAAACSPAWADFVLNGNFESAALADGTFSRTSPTSWSGGALLDNPDSSGRLAGLGFTWPQAYEGSQYVDIGNESVYSLSQQLTLGAGGSYVLSWFDNTGLNIIPVFRTSPYAVSFADATGAIVLDAALDAYHSDGQWLARTALLSLSAGAYTLRFTSTGVRNGTDTLLDAVSLEPATPAQVPTPSTWALVALGLLAGSFACRRRDGSKVEATAGDHT